MPRSLDLTVCTACEAWAWPEAQADLDWVHTYHLALNHPLELAGLNFDPSLSPEEQDCARSFFDPVDVLRRTQAEYWGPGLEDDRQALFGFDFTLGDYEYAGRALYLMATLDQLSFELEFIDRPQVVQLALVLSSLSTSEEAKS